MAVRIRSAGGRRYGGPLPRPAQPGRHTGLGWLALGQELTAAQSLGGLVVLAALVAGRVLIDQALPDHIANENRLLGALRTTERDALADALRNLLESLGDTTD
ncbi:hypothetical protein [Streptomyces sp. NPDC051219]|uniref:hypothetical protein n=1 Tax=Streptomyces sp. NPDC051219 TaxID=3155283 RepID=UPI003422C2AF